MKRIRFWGTRGSLPSALTAAKVRKKVITALRGASGRTFTSDKDIEDYVDGLTFPVAGTYGGHTSCVEIETGSAEYVLCDLGSGLRPFGQSALARHGPGSPQTYHIFMASGACLAMRPEITASDPFLSCASNRPWLVVPSNS